MTKASLNGRDDGKFRDSISICRDSRLIFYVDFLEFGLKKQSGRQNQKNTLVSDGGEAAQGVLPLNCE